MANIWEQVLAVERGFDDAQLRLARPGISSGPEFTCGLLRALSEVSAWAAMSSVDLDDPEDCGRLTEALAAMDQLLAVLRVGLAEATTKEAGR